MTNVIRGRARAALVRSTLALGVALLGMPAHAGLTVSTSADAAPSGVHYVNFDDMSYSHTDTGGLTVDFSPNSGLNIGAQPYLTNSNGAPFGDSTVSGPDATQFLFAGSPLTLDLHGDQHYFGILWGSLDTSNSLSFYAADGTLVGVVKGSDVAPDSTGSWYADGTFYVNIDSTQPFTKVVVDGGDSIFEFDNVAYNASAVPLAASVPEPTGAVLLLAGLLALPLVARKRRAR